MDHVICTNYDGILTLYRGPDLPALLLEVITAEYDTSMEEDEDDDSPNLPAFVLKALKEPTLENLPAALTFIGVDMTYSGPGA